MIQFMASKIQTDEETLHGELSFVRNLQCVSKLCEFWQYVIETSPVKHIACFVQGFYHGLLLRPLAKLFLNGPAWFGIGGWEGKQRTDICAELTKLPSDFWAQNMNTCELFIEKRFYSYVTLLETAFVVYLWIVVLKTAATVIGHGAKARLFYWSNGKVI
jgi:hypothetical protein